MLLTKFRKTVLTTVAAAALFASPVAFADMAEDTAITAAVKAELSKEKDMPKDISVLTKDRVVVLVGNFDTSLQADRAIEVASNVDKVVDVEGNQLKVKGSHSYTADTIITAKVKAKIASLAMADVIKKGYKFNVTTTDGVVHLDGTVADKADLDSITATVEKVKGVKSVKTNVDGK